MPVGTNRRVSGASVTGSLIAANKSIPAAPAEA
jgi:hypothetical protein